MTVLAIETATAVCGVALIADGTLRGEEFLEARNIHAERILGMIDTTLRRAGLEARELDGVAVSVGPGSFTGLRIGLSVAKGLVFGLKIGLAAVPTLEALAWRLAEAEHDDATPYILAALDARRDEVYCQLFRRSEEAVLACGEPQDLPAAGVVALLEGRRAILTGDGAEKVARALPDVSGLSLADAVLRRCSAAMVGRLGERELRAGRAADPATLEPRYIKEFFLRAPSS